MTNASFEIAEETLDPEDWTTLSELGHRMIDDMLAHLERVREAPVWQPVPDAVREQFLAPLPLEGEGAVKAYADFIRDVLPHPTGNIHPRFWGWVMGTGTAFGMLAEMLAAGINANAWGGEQVALHMERQVLQWIQEGIGFPAGASGLLTSGGSMSNLVGLTVARQVKAECDLVREGLLAAPRRMMAYCSSETHGCIQKSLHLLGLGSESLRKIPVTEDFEINVDELDSAIARDRAAGHYPFCVVGNAGTVNTGAIDPLHALADLCESRGLWFHVDGSIGAPARLSPKLRGRIKGLERADSVALSLHKWLHVPYDAGCALVRRPGEHRATFAQATDYMAHAGRGLAAGTNWFSEYGFELSRGSRALKVWMSLKEHGAAKFARLMEQNVDQARHLVGRIAVSKELELLAPVPLNIVCFRFRTPALSEPQLDLINQEILCRLHESGVAVPSFTRICGKYALRIAITNHRSRRDDFDLLADEVIRIGREVVSTAQSLPVSKG